MPAFKQIPFKQIPFKQISLKQISLKQISLKQISLKQILCSVIVLLLVGCGESSLQPDVSSAPFVEVLYEDQPLADVQIRLHESADSPVVAQAITGANGKAHFVDLPSPEPGKYFVTAESISDGGWMLEPKLAKTQTSQLTVLPIGENAGQKIRLPAKSVRSLTPSYGN